MAPAAVQPPEVQFAQRLAANEKRIRDRALKKLRGYIGVRTQRPAGTDRGGPGAGGDGDKDTDWDGDRDRDRVPVPWRREEVSVLHRSPAPR